MVSLHGKILTLLTEVSVIVWKCPMQEESIISSHQCVLRATTRDVTWLNLLNILQLDTTIFSWSLEILRRASFFSYYQYLHFLCDLRPVKYKQNIVNKKNSKRKNLSLTVNISLDAMLLGCLCLYHSALLVKYCESPQWYHWHCTILD